MEAHVDLFRKDSPQSVRTLFGVALVPRCIILGVQPFISIVGVNSSWRSVTVVLGGVSDIHALGHLLISCPSLKENGSEGSVYGPDSVRAPEPKHIKRTFNMLLA